MKTQVEHIPNELWLSIFSYLEAHDLFCGFNRLNNRFDEILASNYLTFYLQLKKQKNRSLEFTTALPWFDGILKRTVCLRSTAPNGCGYVPDYLRKNAHKFIRLQSLTITINTRQTNMICRILQKLPSFEYLSLTCIIIPIIITTMLNMSTLRACHLNTKQPLYLYHNDFNINNNIERFSINFPSVSDNLLTNLLLANMPKLKQF